MVANKFVERSPIDELQVVDHLLLFDSRDIKSGPAFIITSRLPTKPLNLGMGVGPGVFLKSS